MNEIQTYTGKLIDPFNVNPDDIDIKDIAHGLSNICRFTGQCSPRYSVGEHSLYVCALLPDEWKFAGLLHDASEYLLNDLPPQIKDRLPEYKFAEQQLQDKIYRKFGIHYIDHIKIKEVDEATLYHESIKLFEHNYGHFDYCKNDLPVKIRVYSPKVIEYKFLKRFKELYNE